MIASKKKSRAEVRRVVSSVTVAAFSFRQHQAHVVSNCLVIALSKDGDEAAERGQRIDDHVLKTRPSWSRSSGRCPQRPCRRRTEPQGQSVAWRTTQMARCRHSPPS